MFWQINKRANEQTRLIVSIWDILYRNQFWKYFLKSFESFLRKPQFLTLNDLNSGFGGPWDMLGIFLVNVNFKMLQKKSFGEKIGFHAQFQKCNLPQLKNCQNGTFEPVHKIQKLFWTNYFFWSIMKTPFTRNIPNMSQGLPNPL